MLRERAEFIESLERDLRIMEGKIQAVRHDFLKLPAQDYPSRASAIRRSRNLLEEIKADLPFLKARIEANWSGALEEGPFEEDALDRIEVCRYDADIVSGTLDRLTVLVASLAEGWDIA